MVEAESKNVNCYFKHIREAFKAIFINESPDLKFCCNMLFLKLRIIMPLNYSHVKSLSSGNAQILYTLFNETDN